MDAHRRLDVLARQLDGGEAPRTDRRIVVIGAAILDVQARPSGPDEIKAGTSVPGSIVQTPGGVGEFSPVHWLQLRSQKKKDLLCFSREEHCGGLGAHHAWLAAVPDYSRGRRCSWLPAGTHVRGGRVRATPWWRSLMRSRAGHPSPFLQDRLQGGKQDPRGQHAIGCMRL